MISLEEYAKVNSLISTCDEMIDGKFILAHTKISNILKSIKTSNEVSNLISNCLTNFNFEHEFSQAQLKAPQNNNKFQMPSSPEKILPFTFCLLAIIDNKSLNLDTFLGKYFPSDKGHSEEYINFANEVIVPFRDILIGYFDIKREKPALQQPEKRPEPQIKMQNPANDIFQKLGITPRPIQEVDSTQKSRFNQTITKEMLLQSLKHKEKEMNNNEEYEDLMEDDDNLIEESEEETQDNYENEEEFENEEEYDDDDEVEENDNDDEESEGEYQEISAEKIEEFLIEVKSICHDILNELKNDRKMKQDMKENIEYITETIIYDCDANDFKNVTALITSFEPLTTKAKSIRFLARELKRVLISFFE